MAFQGAEGINPLIYPNPILHKAPQTTALLPAHPVLGNEAISAVWEAELVSLPAPSHHGQAALPLGGGSVWFCTDSPFPDKKLLEMCCSSCSFSFLGASIPSALMWFSFTARLLIFLLEIAIIFLNYSLCCCENQTKGGKKMLTFQWRKFP